MNAYAHTNPHDVRLKIRAGEITTQTSGMCLGYAQANLAVLPKDLAYDFLLFAQHNTKPCPILEVTDVGSPYLKKSPRTAISRRTSRNTAYIVMESSSANTKTWKTFGATTWWRFSLAAHFRLNRSFWNRACRFAISKRAKTCRCT